MQKAMVLFAVVAVRMHVRCTYTGLADPSQQHVATPPGVRARSHGHGTRMRMTARSSQTRRRLKEFKESEFFALPDMYKKWSDAEQACKARDPTGQLASIHSFEENDVVNSLCAAPSCWIGLNDVDGYGMYGWSDGTPKLFDNDFLSDGPSDCAMTLGDFWLPRPCSEDFGHGAVCRKTPADASLFALTKPGKWEEAKTQCEAKGMTLAFIHSEEENKATWKYATSNGIIEGNFWIGLHDQNSDDEFEWTDGTPLREHVYTYKNWVIGEPNSYGQSREHCVEMFARSFQGSPPGAWNDLGCEAQRRGICRGSAI